MNTIQNIISNMLINNKQFFDITVKCCNIKFNDEDFNITKIISTKDIKQDFISYSEFNIVNKEKLKQLKLIEDRLINNKSLSLYHSLNKKIDRTELLKMIKQYYNITYDYTDNLRNIVIPEIIFVISSENLKHIIKNINECRPFEKMLCGKTLEFYEKSVKFKNFLANERYDSTGQKVYLCLVFSFVNFRHLKSFINNKNDFTIPVGTTVTFTGNKGKSFECDVAIDFKFNDIHSIMINRYSDYGVQFDREIIANNNFNKIKIHKTENEVRIDEQQK